MTRRRSGLKALLVIGAQRDAIAEARAAIRDILQSSAEQTTKRAALQTLSTLCAVNGATVSNNVFTTEGK